jgi:hypothetical protein
MSVEYPQATEQEPTGAKTTDPSYVRYRAFLARWRTDVAPVHDRCERSREFRAQYAQLTLKSLLVAHGAALVAFPAVARLIEAPVGAQIQRFLFAEGCFLLGALLILVTMLVAYATLDVDVTRQKGERAAARRRLIESEFPEQFGDALEAEGVSAEADQTKHWRLGVGLSWVAMVLVAASILCLALGGFVAGRLLATAAG